MFDGNPPYYAQKYPFIYKDEIINSEILGNITYGYLGASMGYSENTLLQAGELVSVITSGGHDNDEDRRMIRRGISYYEDK